MSKFDPIIHKIEHGQTPPLVRFLTDTWIDMSDRVHHAIRLVRPVQDEIRDVHVKALVGDLACGVLATRLMSQVQNAVESLEQGKDWIFCRHCGEIQLIRKQR